MGLNTAVKIGKIKLKNPVMAAAGTFGAEYSELVDIKSIGAVVAKTITLKPRHGNPPPRLVDTPAGMLNSIGLENAGLENFIKEKLPKLLKFNIPVIASVSADTIEEFKELVRRLDKTGIAGIEFNLSCPNIRGFTRINPRSSALNKTRIFADIRGHPCPPLGRPRGRRARLISQDAKATYNLVKVVRKVTKKTLITKLSPNVTDITEIATAAEKAGSDAVSLVNTFIAMAVDIETRMPKLGAVRGGLSGPAIKPIALEMVWEVFNEATIPIIGIGGIMDYKDALEFIICGATAVQVGTANFVNPKTTIEIIDGIKKYLAANKIAEINKLIGSLKTK